MTRVSITLPTEIVEDIDRHERNRSRFILEAVRRELLWRRREELRRSLGNPHPESFGLAEVGFPEWGDRKAEGDDDLVDLAEGSVVRWRPGEGWSEGDE